VRGRYKLSKETLKLFSLGERKIQVIKGDFETIFIRWKDNSSCGRSFQIDLPIWNPRWTKFCYNDLQFQKFLIQVRNAYCPLNVKTDHVGLLSHGISKSSTFTC
jgi:hypothetical protein